MAATGQQMAYRCDQCGSSEIVALSLLYEQGTRSFSGRFTSGVSQSFTAKAASPPSPRNYVRALFGWGFAMFFCVFWGIAGFRGILQHPQETESLEGAVTFLFCLGLMLFLACFSISAESPVTTARSIRSSIRTGRRPSCAAVAESTP
jgi:hypothetical protein